MDLKGEQSRSRFPHQSLFSRPQASRWEDSTLSPGAWLWREFGRRTAFANGIERNQAVSPSLKRNPPNVAAEFSLGRDLDSDLALERQIVKGIRIRALFLWPRHGSDVVPL